MTGPTDPLEDCMLMRASDLAGWMRRNGMPVRVAQGLTANGTPCTVIIAIGDASAIAAEVGKRLVQEWEAKRLADKLRADRN